MDSDTSDTVGDGQQNTPCDNLFHGYAGFWKRLAAFCIDISILIVTGICLLLLAVFIAPRDKFAILTVMWLALCLSNVVIPWLYFAGFESSSFQATPGKMAVGIKVTDADGNRIAVDRASRRFWGKILSVLIIFVGYLMAAFTRKKQGLHDIIAGCLVVNKSKPRWVKAAVTIVISVAGAMIMFFVGILLPATSGSVLTSKMIAMKNRAKDIYVGIIEANTAREGLGLESVLPKSGEKMEAADDIDIPQMTFANSSDYFTVLYDIENYSTPQTWSPFANGFDYSKFAGAGVPVSPSRSKRLKAKNNAWTIAANITGEMSDRIPVIVSRNIDPTSLIPREGDLRQQFIRPSEEFKTPFGNQGFILIRKGGTTLHMITSKPVNLHILYVNPSEEELQEIRDAFQKIKYLTP